MIKTTCARWLYGTCSWIQTRLDAGGRCVYERPSGLAFNKWPFLLVTLICLTQ
jgi:hypothetical protein